MAKVSKLRDDAVMSVVKINAIEVPEGAGPELEARFAARAGMVDDQPGFEEFMLLRPTAGDDRYFVVTRWESEEALASHFAGPQYAGMRDHIGQFGLTGAESKKYRVDREGPVYGADGQATEAFE